MQHENAQRLLEAVTAFAGGDLETTLKYVSEDFFIRVPGTNKISGEYLGLDAFRGFSGKMRELSDGTFKLAPIDTLGSDQHAVGVYRTTAHRNGKDFDGQIVNLYKVDESGRFAVATVHPSEFAVWNEFWS